jgi:peroxiredoxin
MEAGLRGHRPQEHFRAERRDARWVRAGGIAVGLVMCSTPLQSPLLAQSIAELSSRSTEMIGQVAPEWVHRGWINSAPRELAGLRGSVVLLRFFNDNPGAAAGLRELYAAYRDQGLTVVGIYAPSPMPQETDPQHVRRLAIALGFDFPVAMDSRWETVNRYWLNQADAEATAATFLIDRQGIIRYVQPDGQYDKNSTDKSARKKYENLEKQIQLLLKEGAPD